MPDFTTSTCEAVVAATEETVTLDYQNFLQISNQTGQTLYIVFNWSAGDTEVSSTNFDCVIPNNERWTIKSSDTPPSFPKLRNARIISAGNGRVGFFGW